MKTDKQMAAAAADFAKRWEGKGYERGQSQLFWADLLTTVYGVENLPEFLRYEEHHLPRPDHLHEVHREGRPAHPDPGARGRDRSFR